MTESAPVLGPIKREAGVAGSFALSVVVTYPDEAPTLLRFYGSTYGGPIVMETPRGQVLVDRAVTDRLGQQLTPAWVERFFA